MKTTALAFTAAALLATTASANLISEFEPNPAGADPPTTNVELSGTPLAAYSGFLTFIDTDPPGALGFVNNTPEAVSDNYDANGLAVITLNFDAENPSYMLVFSTLAPAGSVDGDQDGNLDNAAGDFGTVYDAIAVIDNVGDARNYATQLGGQEFATANEWELAFRDTSTGAWYGVDTGASEVYDIDGNLVNDALFSASPFATTYGAVNPTLIPEPTSLALLGLGGLFVARRRKG